MYMYIFAQIGGGGKIQQSPPPGSEAKVWNSRTQSQGTCNPHVVSNSLLSVLGKIIESGQH